MHTNYHQFRLISLPGALSEVFGGAIIYFTITMGQPITQLLHVFPIHCFSATTPPPNHYMMLCKKGYGIAGIFFSSSACKWEFRFGKKLFLQTCRPKREKKCIFFLCSCSWMTWLLCFQHQKTSNFHTHTHNIAAEWFNLPC